MSIVGITLKGEQGSGKTRLMKLVEEHLISLGFNVIVFEAIHGINVVNPIETLDHLRSE